MIALFLSPQAFSEGSRTASDSTDDAELRQVTLPLPVHLAQVDPISSAPADAFSPQTADQRPTTASDVSRTSHASHTDKTETTPQQQTAPLQGWMWEAVVKPGDVLSTLLKKAQVPATLRQQLLRSPRHHLLTRLRAGETLRVVFNGDGTPAAIFRQQDKIRLIGAIRTRKGWNILSLQQPVTVRAQVASAVIHNNLYLDGKRIGLSDKTIQNLINIFRWKLDFNRQLKKNDTFKIIYEKRYLHGKYMGDGRIVAAEVRIGGRPYRAFLMEDERGRTLGYFDEKGESLKKQFLSSPVDYIRITSRFTHRRWHPIQKRWKAHRGVDYAGKIGTPIRATANGVVKFVGWQRGYGRVVYLQHGQRYTTVYAHMSRFARLKKGQRVKQGQIIGYIGKSGWATGPHLHYEFRIAGRHVDPLKIRFAGGAATLPKRLKPHFQARTQIFLSLLDRLNGDMKLAAASHPGQIRADFE